MQDPVAHFSPERIARAIAEDLQAAVPTEAGVSITAIDDTISIGDHHGHTVSVKLSPFASQDLLTGREAETAVRAALSTIQDFVAEALTVPWPSLEAVPDAAVRDGRLTAWFGNEEDPLVRLRDLASAEP